MNTFKSIRFALLFSLALGFSGIVGANDTVLDQNAGRLACGQEKFCDASTQYCSAFFGGPMGVPPDYQCVDLPEECRSPARCECMNIKLGCECTETDAGVTVTCKAP